MYFWKIQIYMPNHNTVSTFDGEKQTANAPEQQFALIQPEK